MAPQSTNLEKSMESQPLLCKTSSSSDFLSPNILDPVTDPNCYSHSSNRSSLGDIPPTLKVYRRRWWVLLIFSLLSFAQSWIWITFSSITISAKHVFDWSDTTIALLVDWGNVPFIFLVFPCCWLLHTKGLRVATVISAILMFIGTALKCITLEAKFATPLIHIAQFLNGIAGIVFTGAPPQLSSSWFPSHQRTTATSIVVAVNYLGIAFGYMVGPVLVPHTPDPECHNISWHVPLTTPCHNSSANQDDIEEQKYRIMDMLYYECGLAGVLLIAVFLYFPKQPPLPPTASATLERLQLKTTLSRLVRNKNFWIICMGYAITNSICCNWLSVLGPALGPFGISQNDIGFMGTASTLAGIMLSLVMARFVDHLGGRIKMFLVIMWCVGCLNFIWYTLLYTGVVTPTLARLYPAVIITGIMAYSGSPLYMELCVEVTYPVHEGLVGLFMQGVYNVVGSVFLALFLVPNIGVSWMNWCLIGSTIVGIVLALLQEETYNRSEVDKAAKKRYEAIPDVLN